MVTDVIARLSRGTGQRPLVLGHRGARHAAPENTQRAFELAQREGADGVELDVRLAQSGEVIVLHDPALSRVTRDSDARMVENMTYADIKRVDVGAGERVPLLAEVLDWASRAALILNVELKADVRRRRDLLAAVISLLVKHPYRTRGVVLSSFDPRFVWRLSRALPDVPVSFLFHTRSPLARAAAFVGARSFSRLGARGMHPEQVLVTEQRLRSWRELAPLIGVWTVNDEARARELSALGVDYLISDRPSAILSAVT
jgi:glycerophosphoryl diester phosphodiesterase